MLRIIRPDVTSIISFRCFAIHIYIPSSNPELFPLSLVPQTAQSRSCLYTIERKELTICILGVLGFGSVQKMHAPQCRNPATRCQHSSCKEDRLFDDWAPTCKLKCINVYCPNTGHVTQQGAQNQLLLNSWNYLDPKSKQVMAQHS